MPALAAQFVVYLTPFVVSTVYGGPGIMDSLINKFVWLFSSVQFVFNLLVNLITSPDSMAYPTIADSFG